MSKIIYDFIKTATSKNTYGFFRNERSQTTTNELDVEAFSKQLTKSQIRQFNRYKIIPKAFISYLKALEILPQNLSIPRCKRTVTWLIDILFTIPYRNDVNRGLGTYLREQLLIESYPEMHVMFGSEKVFENALYRKRNQLH
jgi:hypothetical protein